MNLPALLFVACSSVALVTGTACAAEPVTLPATQPQMLVLENRAGSIQFEQGQHLRLVQIHNKLIDKDCVRDFTKPRTYDGWPIPPEYHNTYGYDVEEKPGRRPRLFAITIGDQLLDSSNFRIQSLENVKDDAGSHLTARLVAEDPNVPFEVLLKVDVDPDHESIWSFSLTHTGTTPIDVEIAWPVLDYLEIGANSWPNHYEGNLSGNWYYVPRMGGAISSAMADMAMPYGGNAWMQVFDVYHPKHNGGLYLWIKDAQGTYKTFEFKKRSEVHAKAGFWMRNEQDTVKLPQVMQFDQRGPDVGWSERPERAGIGIAAHYLPQTLTPGQTIQPPDVVLGLHEGDWHAAIDSYVQWVRTWRKPHLQSPQWWNKSFGIGGLGFHGDEYTSYSFNHIAAKGHPLQDVGILQPINYWQRSTRDEMDRPLTDTDWYHGAYHAETQGYIDAFGGAQGLKQAIDEVHEQGTRVTFYTEGMVLAKNSPIGKDHGPEWAIMAPDRGKMKYFDVYNSNHEQAWNMCPAYSGWQNYLPTALAKLIDDTHADGVYSDSIGARHDLCYNPLHQHDSPGDILQGRLKLFTNVRHEIDAVGPDKVFWLEGPSCDYVSQPIDGSWVWTFPLPGDTHILSYANIFRFAFPEVKLFELAMDPSDSARFKRILFFGTGAYILPNYYQNDLLWTIKQIYEDNYRAFNSSAPLPFIKTLNPSVAANEFPGPDQTIWTLLNDTDQATAGPILTVKRQPNWHYVELLSLSNLTTEDTDEGTTLALPIAPRDLACIAGYDQQLNASCDGQTLQWSVANPAEGDELVAVFVRGSQSADDEQRVLPLEGSLELDLPEASDTLTLVLKLYRDQAVLDMSIISLRK